MLSEFDIYVAFRKAQAKHFNRGFRLPKDWESHLEKMPEKQRENLILITKYFNTKWDSINPTYYFDMGFELYKATFSYNKFFDPKVIKHYINRDKVKKRNINNVEEDLKNSLKHVKEVTNSSDDYLYRYSKIKSGNVQLPVYDFLHNNIGKYFLVLLIKRGYVILSDVDKMRCPLIVENFNEYLEVLDNYFKEGLQQKYK